MKCPSCGREDQKGKFCSQCGAALQAACGSCGEDLAPGSRFCTRCGQATGAARAGRHHWPWVLGVGLIIAILLLFMLPRRVDRAGPPAMTQPATGTIPLGTGSPATGDGLLSEDMRVNADRLFNRVMAAAERGDEAEVARFMPMAVQAYGMVEDLDHDGLFHLAILHLTAGDPARAEATAGRILADSPDHVLALGLAAEAARRAGNDARSRALYRRLLEAYADEAAKPLPEYVDHQRMLPEYRRAAEEALAGTGG